MVDRYGAQFLQWFGTERKLKKKWLLIASKPPITKLKDCPCSNMVGVSISGGGGVLAAGWCSDVVMVCLCRGMHHDVD